MVALGCMCDHNIYTHHFLVAVRCRSSYQHQSGILLSVFSFSLRRRSLVFKPKSGHKEYYLCFVLFLCSLKGSVLLRFNLLEKSDGLLTSCRDIFMGLTSPLSAIGARLKKSIFNFLFQAIFAASALGFPGHIYFE